MAYSQLIDGKSMREIFEENGIAPEILGNARIWGFTEKLRKNADREGGFEDQRSQNSRKAVKDTAQATDISSQRMSNQEISIREKLQEYKPLAKVEELVEKNYN